MMRIERKKVGDVGLWSFEWFDIGMLLDFVLFLGVIVCGCGIGFGIGTCVRAAFFEMEVQDCRIPEASVGGIPAVDTDENLQEGENRHNWTDAELDATGKCISALLESYEAVSVIDWDASTIIKNDDLGFYIESEGETACVGDLIGDLTFNADIDFQPIMTLNVDGYDVGEMGCLPPETDSFGFQMPRYKSITIYVGDATVTFELVEGDVVDIRFDGPDTGLYETDDGKQFCIGGINVEGLTTESTESTEGGKI